MQRNEDSAAGMVPGIFLVLVIIVYQNAGAFLKALSSLAYYALYCVLVLAGIYVAYLLAAAFCKYLRGRYFACRAWVSNIDFTFESHEEQLKKLRAENVHAIKYCSNLEGAIHQLRAEIEKLKPKIKLPEEVKKDEAALKTEEAIEEIMSGLP